MDTNALTEALEKETIGGAALDVTGTKVFQISRQFWCTEPEPLPRDHPLLKNKKNLILTPHFGSATLNTR